MPNLFALLTCAPRAWSETTTYSYDALGRLIQVNGSANGGSVVTYDYDAAGNQLHHIHLDLTD